MQLLARRLCAAMALAAAAFLTVLPASAHETQTETLRIGHPWLRVPPPGANVAAAYMTLTSKGSEGDRLLAVAVPVAERVELHTMTMDGGVMKMRPLENGVEIPAGETVKLEPGGMHVMLIGLNEPIVEGGKVKGVLTFEKAGRVEVEFVMQTMKDATGGEGGHGAGHGMK